MTIQDGSSNNINARMAIDEASNDWDKNFSPDILFVFHSTRQNADDVPGVLAERFPGSLVVGSTTAGEWINSTHQHDSLILLGIKTPDIRWSVALAENLDQFTEEDANIVCNSLLEQLNIHFTELHPERNFCLSFFDGLCKCEENVIAMISTRLANTPLLGGSAGDDLKFENTYVMNNGKTYQNAAIFVLADSRRPFKVIKHQHFVTGDIETIITKADISERIVYHLDGIPAAERYARLLNIDVNDLNALVFSNHPLIYQYQRECYVRSIAQRGENNSLIFYCAIEEGMILNLCSHQNMTQRFKQALEDITTTSDKIDLMFVFNCILRRLEAESSDTIQQHAGEIGAISKHAFGFDTYGEQWNGLHINQTLVALAIYDNE